MNSPSVSVLMPVYNAARHLDAAIASIAEQDFADWEMVAIDDGSTDRSPEILARWASRDGRIRVVTNAANKGQTACLNIGLAACRGDWIARQDADDLSHPCRLRLQTEFLGKHPATVLLGTQGTLVDDAGSRAGLLDVPVDTDSIAWCAPFFNPFLHTAVMFKRDVVAAAGGYDENFRIAQDYELWTRLAADHPTANLPRRLVRYRHSETSLSKTGRDQAFLEADRVSAREAKRFLGRDWTTEEEETVSSFRRGDRKVPCRAFWQVIRGIERETSKSLPSRLRAAWHLRLAGAGAPGEIASAFRAAPFFTARWFFDRFFSS